MRILQVSEYYYPDIGGLPEHMHHLGRALRDRGHAVTLLTTHYPDLRQTPFDTDGLEVIRLGRSSPPVVTNGSVSRAAVGLRLGAEVRALLFARRFDIIHVHGPLFPVLPLLALRHAPPTSRTVATLHTHFAGSPIMRLLRRPLQRYLDAIDGMIAVSPSALRPLEGMGLRLQAELIPNGVDLDYWQGGLAQAERTPRCDGALTLLVQARLEPRNHLDVLLSALSRLRAHPGAPRVRLLLVGDGPLRAALAQAVPPALRADIVFCGARITGRDALAGQSDLYCFTAGIASHPMSLLEGMAAGLPVISHDIEGARELVRDGIEGLLVPLQPSERAIDGWASGWAAAIARLGGDPDLRRRMGQAARRRVEAFGWPAVAAKVEACYERALRRSGCA